MGNTESGGAQQPDCAEEEDEEEEEEQGPDTERGSAKAGFPAPGSALGPDGGPETEAAGAGGPGSASGLSLNCGPGPDILFQHQRLREAAAKVRDEVAENVVQQHHSHLIRWLEERLARGEETIRMAQFCDLLATRFAIKEECEEAFAQFDAEGDGTVAVENMLESLKTSGGANLQGELSHVIRQLQGCSLTPGFVDIFSKNKERMGVHAAKILRFLHRNRIPSNAIPFPMMDSYNNICAMRSSVLKDCLKQLLEKKNEQNIQCSADINGDRELDKLKMVTKCYTTIEASSNSTDIDKMTNGETTSYWQSDGSSCSHWIRLRLKPDVVLKHLSIAVSASDQSYMPQQVTVSLGRNPSNLQEIRDVRIPSNMTGYVTLLENANINHPIVQINIKRCHGDGCDTRIHGLKTMGYQVVKKPGVSVSDASAIWYLTLLTTLVTASIETNPDLAQNVLRITQKALQHMPPLSLTAGSTELPSFMSSNVLEKVDSFLIRIAGCCASPEAELTLLAFALARGSIAKVLRSLLTISDHLDMQYEASPLLTAMASVRLNQLQKYGKPLQLTVEACDAKEGKEKGLGPTAVLYESLLGDGFLSEAGHTRATFIVSTRAKLSIQVSQIRIKVHNGAKGAKCGLIFTYNDDSETFDAEKHFKRFEKYNKWKLQEFRQFVKGRHSSQSVELDGDDPVGWFELEEEWNETEVKLQTCRISKYLMVKFLCPRQEDENNVRIGIKHLSIRGYLRPSNQECVSFSDTASSGLVTGQTLVLKTLYFIQQLAQDAAELRERRLKQKPYLDFSDLNLQLFWNFYEKFRQNRELECLQAQTILLQLLQNCLVLLSGSHQPAKAQDTAQPSTEKKHPIDRESAHDLYVYLCKVVDDAEYDTVSGTMLRKEAVNTILSGAAIFFPDVQTRRDQLFKMMETITEPSQPQSATITFQSLCHYFSNQDPSGLLQLPQKGVPAEFDINPVMMVMDTLLLVATRECELMVMNSLFGKNEAVLVNLLWALQGHLLSWCYLQLKGNDVLSLRHAREILLNYVKRHISSASNVLDFLMVKCSENKIMSNLNDSFLAMATRQLVIFLLELSSLDIPHCSLLQAFAPLAKTLKILCHETGDDFIKLDGESLEKSEEPVFLRMWSMESTHNYENNSHETTVFVCPGATFFEVEFDEKSETEKRYDYLEFTDSRGVKVRYDGKVGTEKWPTSVTFKSGPRLQFLFHSDNCNNEWGYKFMVKAYGLPDVRVPWVADLQLLVSRLMGCLASRALSLNSACGLLPAVELPVEKVSSVVESRLWKPILRHGTCVGASPCPEGTLDGTQSQDTEMSKNDVRKFLVQVALWDPSQDDSSDSQSDLVKRLINLCKKQSAKSEVVGGFGLGSKVDQAVNSVFAAMMYHSSDLHSALRTYVTSGGATGFNEDMAEVYALAEGMKTWMMERKQKYLMMISDKEVQDDNKMNPENINENWIEKSLLLLKFSPFPTKKAGSLSDVRKTDTLQEQNELLVKVADPPTQHVSAESTVSQDLTAASPSTSAEKPQQTVPAAAAPRDDLDTAGPLQCESPASSVSTTPSENLVSPYVDLPSPFSSKPKPAFGKGRLRLLSLRSMEEFKMVPIQDKYPILKNILEFMKDSNISSESVLQVLSLRKAQAKSIIDVLCAVSECLQSLGQPHLFQFSCILFLQEVLACQKELISYHQQLEGCGKERWNELRQAYYNLVLLLVNAVRQFNSKKDWSLLPALSCVQTCLLHLLDMGWEPMDMPFFNDIKLPDLLLAMSQENISIHDSAIHQWSEDDEIADYECNKEWMEECQDGIQLRVWYERMSSATAEEKRRMHMFVARYCDLLNVEISCDGCHKIAPWHRYRCLQCPDMDLCKTCFLGGVMPEHHEDYHKMVNMEYACDHCQGLIIGRRINCNVCDDFDLCFGCYFAKKYPDSHLPTHSITVFPMVTIRISDRHRLIQPYIHNYTWLLFSALALYTADVVTEPNPAEEELDSHVRTHAEALEARCTELITEYLLKAHQGKSLKNSAVLSLLSNVSAESDKDIAGISADATETILSATEHTASNQQQAQAHSTRLDSSDDSTPADDQKAVLSDTQEAVRCSREKIQKKLKSSESDATLASIDSIEWESVQVLEVSGSRGSESAVESAAVHLRGSKTSLKMHADTKESMPSKDQVFAECSQERILGLLAAMLPPVKNDSTMCLPNLRQVLKLLFRVAMQNPGQLIETYHLTLGLLGQLLLRISPAEADEAVKDVLFASWTLLSTAEGNLKYPGWMTAQVLFSLGAVCLDCRISLDWASSVADILRDLNSSLQWQKVIAAFTERCIEELPFHLKRTNIFTLLVLVGFPEVLCRGTHTVYIDNANESHDVIVLKHFTEKIQAVVIDIKTRKRKTVRDYRLTQVCKPEYTAAQPQLIQFLQHFMLIYSHLLQTNIDSSFPEAVEATWLQSLALKGLYKMLQKHSVEEIHQIILQSGLIKLLERKCTKGTGFSKLWLLCDLETLSIMMYSSKKEISSAAEGADTVTEEKEQVSDHESKSGGSVFDLDETKPDPLEGLDEATKIFFQITHDALNAPLHILRAMYELQMRKTDSFFLEVQKRFDGHVITTDEAIQSMSLKWQPNKASRTEDHSTKAVDTDMMIVPCVHKIMGKLCTLSKPLRCEKATEETNPVTQKLITNTESDLQLSFAKQRRTKSSMLLHKELDMRSKRTARDYLYKVNEAISILYARHVLASLLADWPSGVPITEEVLGLSCPSHMAYILDLLMQLEEKQLWEKILQKVLLGCSEKMLGSLAVTACQFMEEPGMDVQVRESKHPYDNNATIEDKVHIPGAIYLSVKFDPRCVSEDGCDELLMSSSSDYKQDRHMFSGSSHKWIDFDIPGDTLYYRFTSDLDTNDWGYKFTVTGGHRGRFLTGFEILKQMLSEERILPHLPLAEIWEWQVGVACQQMGHQRLKAVHLLLKILQCTFHSGCDLTMLKPLWQLFAKMENTATQDQAGVFILPPLHRALTELFFIAENRAAELGVLQDYFVALTTEDHIHHCVMQGLKNIAAISLAINYQNKATKFLGDQSTSQTKPAP
ncbi:zinc finger ZZ-type and EF-hand domain-containing protein 1 isoform X5 [Mustelus asterias]